MSETWGVPVVMDNRPGGSGTLAAGPVAKAAPDGYTLLYVLPNFVISTGMLTSLPYDPVKDFIPIQYLNGGGPFAVTVNAELPIKTLPDLIAFAKARPGAVTYGVEMSSSVVPMTARLIRKRSGMDVVEVPYKTTSQLLQDVVAGRVHYTVGTPISADAMVKAGKLRIVAVTTAARYEGLPDIGTVNETLPGIAIQGFLTLVAPAATPREVVMTMNRALGAALKEPDLKKRMLQIAVIPVEGASPESVADALRAERERWRGFIKELDIQPE